MRPVSMRMGSERVIETVIADVSVARCVEVLKMNRSQQYAKWFEQLTPVRHARLLEAADELRCREGGRSDRPATLPVCRYAGDEQRAPSIN
jgi:hypothetical protein